MLWRLVCKKFARLKPRARFSRTRKRCVPNLRMDPRTKPGSCGPAASLIFSDDAIITLDRLLVVSSWSRGAERLFGYTAREAEGRHVGLLVPPDLADEPDELLGRLSPDGELDQRPLRRRRKNGNDVWVSVRGAPIARANEGIVGFSLTFREVSQKRLLEGRERRQILNALAGLSPVFPRRPQATEDIASVGDSIREIDPLLRLTAREGVEVRTSLHSEPLLIRASPAELKVALLNLFVDANRAMPKGGLLTIEAVRSRPDDVTIGPSVRVSVRDSGAPIPAEYLPRVFEPFFAARELGRGSGLGLAMVHGFVRRSGGWVRVENGPEKGTAFHLYFPQCPEGEAPPGAPDGRDGERRPTS